jgi:hypothetical protein
LDPYKIGLELVKGVERKRLRKISGPVQKGDTWRIRHNEELNRFIQGEDIVKFIKAQRIDGWAM